jgi:hypothetical protein
MTAAIEEDDGEDFLTSESWSNDRDGRFGLARPVLSPKLLLFRNCPYGG